MMVDDILDRIDTEEKVILATVIAGLAFLIGMLIGISIFFITCWELIKW